MTKPNTTPKFFQDIAARVRKQDELIAKQKAQKEIDDEVKLLWDNWETTFKSGLFN